jgi:hypothetical protein
MPTRKQRKRALKERRHEYETVWVDAEGNELEEPPEDVLVERDKLAYSRAKPKAQTKPQARGSRAARTPLPPSWRRASKRALILGAVIFALFFLIAGSKQSGGNRVVSALLISVLYTALFIPFTYAIDRFAYRRWERRTGGEAKKR